MTDSAAKMNHAGATILVMDDDDVTCKTVAFYLESKGFNVIEAPNGRIGLERFRKEKADLLLVDLYMPEMGGFDVLAAIKEEAPETPVIAFSGTDQIADAVEALHMGAWDYILKPLQVMSILLHAIENALEKAALIRENRRYQQQLERDVENRTRELKTTNLALQQEIKERKLAEEKEKFHQQQLLQADKMASLGILVSGVAHEITNPNNFIKTNIPTLSKIWNGAALVLQNHYDNEGDFYMAPHLKYSELADTVPGILNGILNGAARIDNFVKELKNFAVPVPMKITETIDIRDVIDAAVTLLTNLLRKSTNHLDIIYEENIPTIKGNFQHIEQVIINLLENSCQALQNRQQRITVSVGPEKTGEMLKIEVRDEGEGMAPDVLAVIKNPFFTTKREQGGTGLGLSISTKIVEDHHGSLTFESTPGGGTTATLLLPVPAEPEIPHQKSEIDNGNGNTRHRSSSKAVRIGGAGGAAPCRSPRRGPRRAAGGRV